MLNKHWQKLLKEEDDMSSVASALWTAVIFGGVTALSTLYFLDTRTQLHPALKGLVALASGAAIGVGAARMKWFRVAAIGAVVVLTLLHAVRGLMHT